MKTPKPKKLLIKCKTILYDIPLDGPVDEVIGYLEEEKRKALKLDYFDISLYYDYFDGTYEINMVGNQLETEEEYNTRMALAKKYKAKKKNIKLDQEKSERLLFEKLKKKYGND